MKIKTLSVLILLMVSSVVHSKYVTLLNGPGVEITRVFSHTSGAVTLYISGTVVNLDQCNTTYRVYIPHDIAGHDTMVSTALMAYASGKKVGMHASGCNTTAFWGASGGQVPIIDNLWTL